MTRYYITHRDEAGERHQLDGYYEADAPEAAIVKMLVESGADDDGRWEAHQANHPNRSQTARKQAQAAGYYIREGAYQGTPDDRLGRWYVGHDSEDTWRPMGSGYRTQREAWEAALDHARMMNRL